MSCAAKAAWIISEEEPEVAAAFLFDMALARVGPQNFGQNGAKLAGTSRDFIKERHELFLEEVVTECCLYKGETKVLKITI